MTTPSLSNPNPKREGIDHEFKSHPDVFWPAARGEKTFEFRKDDRGGYPLSRAGKYTAERINEGGSYYTDKVVRYFQRFAVACDIVEGLAEILPTKIVDCWQEGPHLLNTAMNRAALRRARYRPARRPALAPEIKEGRR